MPGMWEEADLSGGWADTEDAARTAEYARHSPDLAREDECPCLTCEPPADSADDVQLRTAALLVKQGMEDKEIYCTKPINRALRIIVESLLNDGDDDAR